MQDGNARQLIVERIKSATNILVTVSTNPSVDALSAALGFSLMLNKMDKHATAVFSGQIPPAINFLEPGKTFENTVDSLRDFIIALDKEKADRLRYKVEGDLVRIFITPYRTTITEKDLQFSQGDFNVDLVVALGVEKREELDNAIVAHGRILHDATVATINARADKNGLGSIDWQDEAASSLCEMLMSLSEALQPGLLDQQISTALLTGIVAATDRFSNQHTSPRVMTMAAQLMAAGANQQLIAAKLQEGRAISPAKSQGADGSTSMKEGESSKVTAKNDGTKGEIHVDHEGPAPLPSAPVPLPPPAQTEAEAKLDQQIAATAPPAAPLPDLAKALQEEAEQHPPAVPPPQPTPPSAPSPPVPAPPAPAPPPAEPGAKPSWMGKRIEPMGGTPAAPPSMGGTLSATSEQALEDRRREEEERRNRTLLSHDTPVNPPPAFNHFGLPPAGPQGGSIFGDNADYIETPVTPRDNPALAEVPAPLPPQPAVPPAPAPIAPPPLPPAASAAPPAPIMPPQPLESSPFTPPSPSAQPGVSTGHQPTLAELEQQAHQQIAEAESLAAPAQQVASDVDQARRAVDAAFNTAPFDPAHNPAEGLGVQPMPSTQPNQYLTTPPGGQPAPGGLGMPDFNMLPPAPEPTGTPGQANVNEMPPAAAPVPPPATGETPSPGLGTFRIPGQ